MMNFYYGGDEPGGRILSWFKLRLEAIGKLYDAELPEAALTIIYSGIDSFGWLAAPPGDLYASRKTFMPWCEKYVLARLNSVDGNSVTSMDLYGARSGILHTSTPLSSSEDKGANQVCYQFKDRTGVNMILNAKQAPIRIAVLDLGLAFKEGGITFLTDLKNHPQSQKLAEARAQHFLRWGKVEP